MGAGCLFGGGFFVGCWVVFFYNTETNLDFILNTCDDKCGFLKFCNLMSTKLYQDDLFPVLKSNCFISTFSIGQYDQQGAGMASCARVIGGR